MIPATSRREEAQIQGRRDLRLAGPADAGCAGPRPCGRRSNTTPAAGGRRAALVVAVAALAACEPVVQGNGIYHEETRSVPVFQGVSTQDGIELQITAGAAQQAVTISGDQNIVPRIETNIVADPRGFPVLQVKSQIASFDSTNPVKVVIAVAALRSIHATHRSPVVAAQVQAQSFQVDADDSAVVTLSGAGGAAIAANLATATLEAREYPVDTATVALSGGATATFAARVRVDGTAKDANTRVQNTGAATCDVELSGGATAACTP